MQVSSFGLLGIESRDFSQAEKERTAWKAVQIHKMTTIFTQNNNLGPWPSRAPKNNNLKICCHFAVFNADTIIHSFFFARRMRIYLYHSFINTFKQRISLPPPLRLSRYGQSFPRRWLRNLAPKYVDLFLTRSKGQKISKANFAVLNSPPKQTKQIAWLVIMPKGLKGDQL